KLDRHRAVFEIDEEPVVARCLHHFCDVDSARRPDANAERHLALFELLPRHIANLHLSHPEQLLMLRRQVSTAIPGWSTPPVPRRPDSFYNLLRLDRGRVELGAERRERVADGVGDRRRGCDRTTFADTFDAERVER